MTDHTIPNAAVLNGWRKSSYSGSEGGSCVEVLDGYALGVPVRDSKDQDGPALIFGAGTWSIFISTLKGGKLQN
ncbi:DUF397 domain-containing protein [Streptomyces fungicidicus]|jgi:hypothetical protein|uniref:DUF397 domain-containing protein n=1 Tax=Streptomyces fungicidicus TaxID=68203 RepID=UPI00384CA8DF